MRWSNTGVTEKENYKLTETSLYAWTSQYGDRFVFLHTVWYCRRTGNHPWQILYQSASSDTPKFDIILSLAARPYNTLSTTVQHHYHYADLRYCGRWWFTSWRWSIRCFAIAIFILFVRHANTHIHVISRCAAQCYVVKITAIIINARRYASAVYTVTLCLCPSVWPSVHRNQCSIKTAKVVIRQNNNHNSTGTLVFLMLKVVRMSKE